MIFRQMNYVLCLLLLLCTSAVAFDGNRTGFQLGIGAGAHSIDLDSSDPVNGRVTTSELNMAFNFSAGYGFTEQFAMIFGGVTDVLSVEGKSIASTFAGVGVRYYLSPQTPSVFFTGIIGNGVLSEDDESFDDSPNGSGWLLGIGYELFDRVHLLGSYFQADLTDPDDNRFKNDVAAFNFTLDYIWY